MVPTQRPPTERDKSRGIPEEMGPRSRMQKPESKSWPRAQVHERTFLTHVRTGVVDLFRHPCKKPQSDQAAPQYMQSRYAG
jgi:hypothetical protein